MENKKMKKFDWSGSNFGKVLWSDLDGVILKFDGFKGNNIFGEVIDGAEETLQYLHDNGWHILIFTSRLVTFELITHLDLFCNIEFKKHYDNINGRKIGDVIDMQTYELDGLKNDKLFRYRYWDISPDHTSFKPIASVSLDDMSIENGGKNYTKRKWLWVKNECIRRFP